LSRLYKSLNLGSTC